MYLNQASLTEGTLPSRIWQARTIVKTGLKPVLWVIDIHNHENQIITSTKYIPAGKNVNTMTFEL